MNNMEDQTTAANETEEVEEQEPTRPVLNPGDVVLAVVLLGLCAMICTTTIICSDNFLNIWEKGKQQINITLSPVTPGKWGGQGIIVTNFSYPNL